MASFAEAMLDGWDHQFARGDGVLRSSNTQADFFKNLAKVELAYSRGLQSLATSSRVHMDSDRAPETQKEVGSSLTALRVILAELENVATAHKEFADALEGDLTKPIHGFTKEKIKSKKKLVSDANKIQKDWKTAQDKLNKQRDTYVGKCKDAEGAEASHQRGKEDETMKPSALAKLAAKSSQAADKAATADSDYQNMLGTTNQKQTEYYTKTMPTLLGEWQKWEEDRLQFMNGMLQKFAELNSKRAPVHAAAVEAVSGATGALSVEEDIQAYCSEQGTGVGVPDDIPYTPHGSELPATSASSSSKGPATPAKKGGKGKYQAPGAKGAAFDDSKYGSAAGVTDPDALAEQIEELDASLKSARKAHEGLENLVSFYANDPNAQKDAQGELDDSASNLQMMEDTLARLHEEAGGGGGAGAGGGDDSARASEAYDEDPADDQYEEEAPESSSNNDDAGGADDGDGGEVAQVKGLYDYEATCDTELTFAEGEILNVTSKDNSGWWYVQNSEGTEGFVPSNYVEEV
jgi:formin-binding protein 1